MTTYRWKPHSVVPVDAQIAGEELERIRVHHNGQLTQEAVVETAKANDNPLHPAFEWRDKVAAHQYRLTQASYMIRNITVVKQDRADAPAETFRAFVSVTAPEEKRPSYVATLDAMADPDLREQVLAAALKELAAWRNKYAELKELADVFAAADGVLVAA